MKLGGYTDIDFLDYGSQRALDFFKTKEWMAIIANDS